MVLHVFLWRSAREGGGVRQRGWSSGAGAVPGCGHRGAASSAPALPQGLPWGSPTLRALGRGSGPGWVCWGGGWEAAAVLAVNRRHWDGQKAGTDGQRASITLHPHPLGPGSQGGLGAAAWAVPGTSGVPVTLLRFSETAGAERSLWVQNLGLHAGVLQNSALWGAAGCWWFPARLRSLCPCRHGWGSWLWALPAGLGQRRPQGPRSLSRAGSLRVT